MRLIYMNRDIEIIECKSFFSRLKGFMFVDKIEHGILFNKCNSIHTFFMKTNIDVIMCDKDNTILYYYRNLGKNKVILPKHGVYKTIELPADFCEFKINDTLRMV